MLMGEPDHGPVPQMCKKHKAANLPAAACIGVGQCMHRQALYGVQ